MKLTNDELEELRINQHTLNPDPKDVDSIIQELLSYRKAASEPMGREWTLIRCKGDAQWSVVACESTFEKNGQDVKVIEKTFHLQKVQELEGKLKELVDFHHFGKCEDTIDTLRAEIEKLKTELEDAYQEIEDRDIEEFENEG